MKEKTDIKDLIPEATESTKDELTDNKGDDEE